MIKKASLLIIDFYQAAISPMIKLILGASSMCRFEETCSAYTKRMISEKGVLRGSGLGAVRLLKCQPLTS